MIPNLLPYDNTAVTVELREVVKSGVKIWDFDYPSYYTGDEKAAFEQKVIDHFYLRQIGQETVGRFLHMFRSRVREIMPRYVELYRSVEIMHGLEDPFGNVDIVETYEEEREGSTTDESTGETSLSSNAQSTGNAEKRFSDTPQGAIENLDNYLTEATIDATTGTDETTSTGTNTSTGMQTNTGTVRHTLTRKGNQGVNTYAHDMIEFRNAIIDVDMMIINDLNCLFLGVY